MNLNNKYIPKKYINMAFPKIVTLFSQLPDYIADKIIDRGDAKVIESIISNPEQFSPIFQESLKELIYKYLPISFDDKDISVDTVMSCLLNSYFSENLYLILTNTVYAKVIDFLDDGQDEVLF
jgi:hypothetical protein